ncbi:vacuolar protein sorting-associated protein 28 [Thecamonas trahens ATCC 50062]|uniref:Vacuolar protein sorting-associated protein 28 n=1 Tax=Thecamonas trahens ATCC 50062 TaxID=461836 RepID=A0A0L0D2T7_THETB|nr:vacuolar protein sorting-associated protein 28 [Thecamonas trahens ATCC 50062]KNC46627.1 vacuolar protein sorting-associated protein 28 [Thecamonas trahens ATCC 50062]|eukprot:XP_013760400.1 vacuolar protein sorting-associated protein 28 [Thecamonas trahens ATCC 50062]
MAFSGGQQYGYGSGGNPLMRPPPPGLGSNMAYGRPQRPAQAPAQAPHVAGASNGLAESEEVEEVKLWATSREREKVENMADLYAIILTVELLEKAYIRDSISADEYTPACSKLIAQFKAAQNLLSSVVPDIQVFMAEYRMECPAAVNRLLTIGVPATVEHGALTSDDSSKHAQHVAEAVHHFISALDALKIGLSAVDEIHPVLKDLLTSLNAVASLPPDYDGKATVKQWLTQLNQMQASDNLSETETRQLLFDLETAYNGFHTALK